jgi:hypothetical protein
MPTLLQKVDIALGESAGGEKISAQYRRADLMRTWTRCFVALGFIPLPGSESLRTLGKSPDGFLFFFFFSFYHICFLF